MQPRSASLQFLTVVFGRKWVVLDWRPPQIATLRHLGKHRNIVSLHDVLYAPNETIMFTDLVQGGELFDYIVDMVGASVCMCTVAIEMTVVVLVLIDRNWAFVRTFTGLRVRERRESLAPRRLSGARVHALARDLVRTSLSGTN